MKNQLPRAVIILLSLLVSTLVRASTLDELEDVARAASSLDEFLAKPELVARYKSVLKSYLGTDRYTCRNFEDILETLKQLTKAVPHLKEKIWEKVTLPTYTFETVSKVKYVVRPVPRRFHGLWSDPSLEACGTQCDKTEDSGPERWAVALEGSRLYYVETGGRYADASLLVVPVVAAKKKLGLVFPVGAPVFRKPEVFKLEDVRRRSRLLDVWLEAVSKEDVGPWSQTALVEFDDKSKMSRLSLSAGHADAGAVTDMEISDPLSSKIAQLVPRKCFASKDSSANDLLVGMSKAQSNSLFFPLSGSEKKNFNSWLMTFSTPKEPTLDGKALGRFKGSDVPKIELELKRTLLGDPDPKRRAKAGLALNFLKKAVDLPPYRVPLGSSFNSQSYLDSLNEALNDSSPEVRGIAGMGLSQQGLSSPEIQKALEDGGRGGRGPASPQANLSPNSIDPSSKASPEKDLEREKQNVPPSRNALNALGDRAFRERNPQKRKDLMDEWADRMFQNPRGDSLDTLMDLMQRNRQAMPEFIEELNEARQRECAACKRAREKRERENG